MGSSLSGFHILWRILQFDPLHPPQMGMPLYGRPDAQGLGFPPFVGGVGPSLGPGPGAPLRPVFLPETAYPERPKKVNRESLELVFSLLLLSSTS